VDDAVEHHVGAAGVGDLDERPAAADQAREAVVKLRRVEGADLRNGELRDRVDHRDVGHHQAGIRVVGDLNGGERVAEVETGGAADRGGPDGGGGQAEGPRVGVGDRIDVDFRVRQVVAEGHAATLVQYLPLGADVQPHAGSQDRHVGVEVDQPLHNRLHYG